MQQRENVHYIAVEWCESILYCAINKEAIMKRSIVILSMAVAVALLSNAVYAEDEYECQFRCSNEKYDRNINCPSLRLFNPERETGSVPEEQPVLL